MSFHDFAVRFLLSFSSLIGVTDLPKTVDTQWQITQTWTENPFGFWEFEAKSQSLADSCNANPEGYISFPSIIHGSHLIYSGGKLVSKFGDPTFSTMRSFYGAPYVKCAEINPALPLSWKVISYTKYFARISQFPNFTLSKPRYNLLSEAFNLFSAGGLYLLAVFAFVVFRKKAPLGITVSLIIACIGGANYFLGALGGIFDTDFSMITFHKFADINIWLGICFFINALRIEGLITANTFFLFAGTVIGAVLTILFGSSGDVIQFGTTLPMPMMVGLVLFSIHKLILKLRSNHNDKYSGLQAISYSIFALAVINEISIVTGLKTGAPLLTLGMLFGLLFFALAVNRKIQEAYDERDHLRDNLEVEVERKTAELSQQSFQLESTIKELKTTQAELVQSAKLASLGTLSAGIAHEINNSLNYVNGAMAPLEKIVATLPLGDQSTKVNQLFHVMKDGLKLTLDIIKSLRNYTGLNQAKFNDVKVSEIVNSVLVILKNKYRDKIKVNLNIPESLSVFGSVVGLNQVFMNIISNSLDSMDEEGQLDIKAQNINGGINIEIQDSGCGIPDELQARIFEPFFTTKEVGKGTGLGLYIVKSEIEKHKGNIKLDSKIGKGTKFTIWLPTSGQERLAA